MNQICSDRDSRSRRMWGRVAFNRFWWPCTWRRKKHARPPLHATPTHTALALSPHAALWLASSHRIDGHEEWDRQTRPAERKKKLSHSHSLLHYGQKYHAQFTGLTHPQHKHTLAHGSVRGKLWVLIDFTSHDFFHPWL